MKIVFFCIPAHGHTNPTLGVVRELVARGHEVWYYSFDMFREKIEETGAKFLSCDCYHAEKKLTPKDSARLGDDLAFSTQILVDTTLAMDEMVCRDMVQLRPNCIVADSMAVWGKAAARKLGIPFVSSTTTFAFNQYSAKIMPQKSKDLLKMLMAMPRANRHVRRLQNRGYPVKNVLDIISNDNRTHTIVYTSPEFQPMADTFSKEYYSFVGPSIRPVQQEFHKTAQKLIYISMGTVNNAMVPFYNACIQALGGTPWQVVMSVGNQISLDVFGEIPENISIYPSVDQIAVLKCADVFLTHCGMNSVSEALYFGVPLVMSPKTREQEGVAARVAELGAGVFLQTETEKDVLSSLHAVLQEHAYRNHANQIMESFRACPGAAGAADKIESICNP